MGGGIRLGGLVCLLRHLFEARSLAVRAGDRALLYVLRRSGVPEQTVQALDAALDDPVDVTRDANLFLRYGITLDSLIDSMGGSP